MQLRYVAADSDEGRHLVRLFAKCVSVRKCRTGWSYKHTYKEIWQKDTWSDCLQNVSHQGNAKKVDIWSDALILLLQELLQMAKWCDWHSTVELEVTLKESCLTKGLQVQQDSQDLHMYVHWFYTCWSVPPTSLWMFLFTFTGQQSIEQSCATKCLLKDWWFQKSKN